MFKLECTTVEELDFGDRKLYKVWFLLPGGGLAWLYSSKPVEAGADVDIKIISMATQDTKTNLRLGLKIV